MTEYPESESRALQSAAAKRVELKQALSQVEMAAASPYREERWRPRLIEELEKLRVAMQDHIDDVEGADGLLDEMLVQAPRLANQISSVRDEHPDLCNQIEKTIIDVRDKVDVVDVRAEVLDTLTAIARHRQRGSDLVYDAYNVDIGGGS
ncbi:MAG: hypothetical protein R2710_08645 [Acidimicrobiales bacterium]